MTDHITEVAHRVGASHEAFSAVDVRSMRIMELAVAFTAIAVAVLLAGAPPVSP